MPLGCTSLVVFVGATKTYAPGASRDSCGILMQPARVVIVGCAISVGRRRISREFLRMVNSSSLLHKLGSSNPHNSSSALLTLHSRIFPAPRSTRESWRELESSFPRHKLFSMRCPKPARDKYSEMGFRTCSLGKWNMFRVVDSTGGAVSLSSIACFPSRICVCAANHVICSTEQSTSPRDETAETLESL